MASRTHKNSKMLQNDYNSLIISDVLCPICRNILIEPVTLPCNHRFCYSCFEGTMENSNLVCPLCRMRIGSWLRRATKESRVINHQLWKIIKEKFPQQVGNKLKGIDENLEEEPNIIVSYPGEIRKEYEMQKKKEDEEIRKKREADINASEELIKKLKEEEDFEKAVMEEKLKLDEQVARKLAEEFSINSPSTSKVNAIYKKHGPMDKFVRKDNETVTSEKQIRPSNNFASKEYTCRVLYLDNSKSDIRKAFSPIIRKRIQQIQKIVDTDTNSDGSDCIESEMRYFKPIDYRLNPPSQGKSPIKIPCQRALKNGTANILSPSGLINFHSNMLESAFARILALPTAIFNESSVQDTSNALTSNRLKRSHPEEESCVPNKRSDSRKEKIEQSIKESPNSSVMRTQFHEISTESGDSSSPLFYGFENSNLKTNSSIVNYVKKNGVISGIDEDMKLKLLQEKADLEFAKKLQEELNRTVHNTRSSQRNSGSSRTHRRQTTLDEILNPYRVK